MGPNDCDPNATFKLEDIKVRAHNFVVVQSYDHYCCIYLGATAADDEAMA